jgi:hypothetical protein
MKSRWHIQQSNGPETRNIFVAQNVLYFFVFPSLTIAEFEKMAYDVLCLLSTTVWYFNVVL